MKIANKIGLSFLLAGIIFATAATSIAYITFRNNLKRSIFAHLRTTAQSRASHIKTFLEEHKKAVELLAEGIIFRELLSTSKDTQEYNECLERVNSRIKNVVNIDIEILKVELSDKSGIVVASTEEAFVGSDISAGETYLKGKEANYIRDIYISEANRKPVFDMATPVLLNDEFLGVIVINFSTEMLFKILLDRTGLDKTGELYLVNKDHYMISPSRFREDVILNQKVDTINARNSLMFKDKEHVPGENAVSFQNYRGINVLGTSVYIPQMQWALLVEIDRKEALAPLGKTRVLFIAILIFTPLGAWAAGFFASRIITNPIYKLYKGTEIIGRGNLDYRLDTDSKDEIGQLSKAFDKMTDGLKKTTTSIDKLNKEIVQRKQAEERQNQLLNELSIVLNSVGDALVVMDNNLIIRTVNPAFLDLTMKKKEEVEGKPCRDVLKCKNEKGEDLCATECSSKKTVSKGTKSNARFVIQNSEGEMITVTSINSPLRDSEGKIIGSVKAMRDISKDVEIDRMKNEFIANVSHQLGTPLTSMEGYIDLILDGDTGEINKLQREFLGIVSQSTKRLESLINDLLDTEKIESGKLGMEFEKISLSDLANNAVRTVEQEAKKKGLRLISQIKEGIEIYGDSDRMTQVLTNLISNAIKFTKQGEVTVKLRLINDNSEIIVQDTGIGISRSDQKKLFTKFFRADNAYTRFVGGTGFGLSISKEIVKSHGGEIRVKSKLNKGSEFRVIIPLGRRREK
jgi:PAS domain S-box-containing protein